MIKYFYSLLITFSIFTLQTGKSEATDNKPEVESKVTATRYFKLAEDSTDLLSAFSAKIKEKEIHLIWKITNLKYISYLIVEMRDVENKIFEPINSNKRVKRNDFIEKSKDENEFQVLKFTYTDEPEKDGVYYYRLKAYNQNNELLFESDEIKIGISGIKDFILEQNQPNPFNPTTSIKYELFSDTYVTLKIFDLIGREITTLIDRFQAEGKYTVEFDASKFSNLTSGIYFYKLTTENYSDVKKMILSK
ncbi:MAG: T9SS type A sorting domain-containing protein [Ignavibacteria bacterium]